MFALCWLFLCSMEGNVGERRMRMHDVNVNELKFSRDEEALIVDFGSDKLKIVGLTEPDLVKIGGSITRVMHWNIKTSDLLRIAATGAHDVSELYILNGYLHIPGRCSQKTLTAIKTAYASLVRQEKSINFALWNDNRPVISLENAIQRMHDVKPECWHFYGNGRICYPYDEYSLELFMFVMAERSAEALEMLIELREKLTSDDKFWEMLESLEALNIRGNQIVALNCSEVYDAVDLPMAVYADTDSVVKVTNDMMQVVCNGCGRFDNRAIKDFSESASISSCSLTPNAVSEGKEAVKSCTAF